MSQGVGAAPGWTLAEALRTVPHILQHGAEDPWRSLPDAQRDELFLQISPIDGRLHTRGPDTLAARCALPWYANTQLVRLVTAAWGNLAIYYLVLDGQLFHLNGTSLPIHEANRIGGITLTPENVLEYLKFFCFFVRGAEGPFYILEDTDHPILDFALDEPTKNLFDSFARSATCTGPNENGAYTCDAAIFYGPALFTASFSVEPSGMIEMLDDAPVAVHLPVRIDARITP